MNELDCVRLLQDYEGLPRGSHGAIVLKYDEKWCEVEFFDDKGNTLAVCMTPLAILEKMFF